MEEDDIVALWEAGMNLPVLADADVASDWDCIVDALLEDKLLGECSDLWISPECRAAAIKDAARNRNMNSRPAALLCATDHSSVLPMNVVTDIVCRTQRTRCSCCSRDCNVWSNMTCAQFLHGTD